MLRFSSRGTIRSAASSTRRTRPGSAGIVGDLLADQPGEQVQIVLGHVGDGPERRV